MSHGHPHVGARGGKCPPWNLNFPFKVVVQPLYTILSGLFNNPVCPCVYIFKHKPFFTSFQSADRRSRDPPGLSSSPPEFHQRGILGSVHCRWGEERVGGSRERRSAL